MDAVYASGPMVEIHSLDRASVPAWAALLGSDGDQALPGSHEIVGALELPTLLLHHDDILRLLHNPCYAGAFVFGRMRTTKTADGKVHIATLPREEWQVVICDAHMGYITWEELRDSSRNSRQTVRPIHHSGSVRCGRGRSCCRDSSSVAAVASG